MRMVIYYIIKKVA